MHGHGVGSTLAVLRLLCLTSATASKEERVFEVAYAEATPEHQRGKVQNGAPVKQERLAEDGEQYHPRGESPRLRASQKHDGAAKKDTSQDEQGIESPEGPQTSGASEKQEVADGHGSSWEAEGTWPDDGPSSESTPSTSQDTGNTGSSQPSASHEPAERPAVYQGNHKWRVFAEAHADLPLFGDMQQFSFPRLDATQFSGFTSLPILLGRSDSAKPRYVDGPSLYQSLFDFSGSTIPFFSFVDVLRAGEAAGATPIHHWSPILGDLKLPGWHDFGGAGRLRNATISLPGLGGRGGLPLGTLGEIPVLPTLSDLLQDPFNVEQLHTLFKDALTQLQESPVNADKLRDTVDEIVRRVTPQESIVVKQIIRAYKERDARRSKILAEAILEAANRVGQQLKGLKEVSVGGLVSPDGEVSASGSSLTSLGDLKEVLDIEEAFARFRGALEQLLAPLLNVLPAFSPPSWTPSASAQLSAS